MSRSRLAPVALASASILSASMLLAAGCPTAGLDPDARLFIRGRIVDGQGDAVPGARLNVYRSDDGFIDVVDGCLELLAGGAGAVDAVRAGDDGVFEYEMTGEDARTPWGDSAAFLVGASGGPVSGAASLVTDEHWFSDDDRVWDVGDVVLWSIGDAAWDPDSGLLELGWPSLDGARYVVLIDDRAWIAVTSGTSIEIPPVALDPAADTFSWTARASGWDSCHLGGTGTVLPVPSPSVIDEAVVFDAAGNAMPSLTDGDALDCVPVAEEGGGGLAIDLGGVRVVDGLAIVLAEVEGATSDVHLVVETSTGGGTRSPWYDGWAALVALTGEGDGEVLYHALVDGEGGREADRVHVALVGDGVRFVCVAQVRVSGTTP